jgi:hypothetical protein
MIHHRSRWVLRLRFLGAATALTGLIAAGNWWAARSQDREGLLGGARSVAEILNLPGMAAYALTGGVHVSPLPYWAIAPFVCVTSGLAWAGVAVLAARAVRRFRGGNRHAHAA